MRRWLEIGGLVAGVVLVAFGIASLALGINGHSTVQDSIKQEQIVGSPDMTPDGDQGGGGEGGSHERLAPELQRGRRRPSPTGAPRAASRSTCGSTRSRRRVA